MNLEDARKHIDNVDKEIVRLFEERMKAVREVAEYKKNEGMPVLNSMRESEILAKLTSNVPDELKGYLSVLYSTMFDVSRAYQIKKIGESSPATEDIKNALEVTNKMLPQSAVIACQGTSGAYSQKAAGRLFQMPSVMFFEDFRGVFNAVKNGMCKYGILPLENSVQGTVTEVCDLMADFDFSIVKSVKIQINHVLAANNPSVNLTKIMSHPQAIGQCSKYLEKKGVKVVPCGSTAFAAQAASEEDGIAAICSRECAELYGLKIIDDNIVNSDNNYTRFICISKDREIYPGADKSSFMLTLPHTRGALYRLLSTLACEGINLTRIESRPISGRDFEFSFYVEAEASVYSEAFYSVLSEIERTNNGFKFFGCYSEI